MNKKLRVKDFGIPEAIPGETADIIEGDLDLEIKQLQKEFAEIMVEYKVLIYEYIENPKTPVELKEFIKTDKTIIKLLGKDKKYRELCASVGDIIIDKHKGEIYGYA